MLSVAVSQRVASLVERANWRTKNQEMLAQLTEDFSQSQPIVFDD